MFFRHRDLKYERLVKDMDKALTIKQPWASLIINGRKDIENRTWKTNYRGRVWIHAGLTKDKKATDLYGSPTDLPVGAVIGSVQIVNCVQNHRSNWAMEDMWHWVLENPQPLIAPYFIQGKLGLWSVGSHVEEMLR